jgi:uncharacterized protein (TIGR00251 family)
MPQAKITQIIGVGEGGELRLKVAAPPAEGNANQALVTVLAKEMGVPRYAVTIKRGQSSRTKLISVAGVGRDAVLARWPGLIVNGHNAGGNAVRGR